MKPEKLVEIMLITLLLSCEMEDRVDHKIGKVSFETNQHIMNSSFDIDIYVDGKKIGSINNRNNNSNPFNISQYYVKLYLHHLNTLYINYFKWITI